MGRGKWGINYLQIREYGVKASRVEKPVRFWSSFWNEFPTASRINWG